MHTAWKKCRSNRIVKLNIIGDNNESRTGIDLENKLFASYRCSKADVIDIYNPFDNTHYNDANSLRDNDFIYKVGECVTVPNYDQCIENVESAGIHYYLTEECAIYTMLLLSTEYTGFWKSWTANGRLLWHMEYKYNKERGMVVPNLLYRY